MLHLKFSLKIISIDNYLKHNIRTNRQSAPTKFSKYTPYDGCGWVPCVRARENVREDHRVL